MDHTVGDGGGEVLVREDTGPAGREAQDHRGAGRQGTTERNVRYLKDAAGRLLCPAMASAQAPVKTSPEKRKHRTARQMLGPNNLFVLAEDVVHYLVALLLLGLAAMVLWNTLASLLKDHPFSTRVIDGINGVLFVVIVMELLHTVLAHFERAGFQLKPFLIIGIISAVRHILTIGARLTLAGDLTGDAFSHAQIELGVNSGVVLGLIVGLLLVNVGERMQPETDCDD